MVTDPDFESTAAFALVTELVDFAASYRLNYVASLVTESESICPPCIGGEPALSRDVIENMQFELECLALVLPRFAFILLCPEEDPDALDIPTPRFYSEAIAGEYSSQWHTAMDADMASWKSTYTYVDKVSRPRANIVDGVWIFRVKRPPGSPPSFKAPGEWHDTLRTTLAALGFVPSSADPLLFLRTDTSLLSFYVLVYVDDLVFATADTESLALVKGELQERHICTDLGELRSYLGLQINRDRARRTITLTQSHMVHQVLQCLSFTWSSPQPTPLPTGHSLSGPLSDESVEPSGPYPELVGFLMYLMTCTRPDLAYPLSLLARYVSPGRHQKVHWEAAKRALRYLCSTSGMGLVLGGRDLVVLTGHSDASWADDQATQRSSQGYIFSLGSGSVSWRSTRSSSVLSSCCETEIYDGAMAAQELRWLTYLLTDLGERPRSPPVLQGSGEAAEKRSEPLPSKIEALDGSNYKEWSGQMRSVFKRYELLKLAIGEEKMPEEGDARDRWIERSAVLFDLILQSVNNDMFQHIKDLIELDDSGPKAWKLLRDVIQPNTLPMVIVLEKELVAISMRSGDDVKPVLDKISMRGWQRRAARSYGRTSAGATREVVLPTKLPRGMELQEAAEEEGEGEAEAVGEALAEGEAEVTTMRGMGALEEGGAPEWRVCAGCTSHMTSRADLLDKVKPPGKIRFVAAALGALLSVIGVGNAKTSKAKVTFGPTSCRAKLGKLLLWDLEEKRSCIEDLWQLPIIPWNGKPPATATVAATAKATAGGEETAQTDGALDAVKKVQPQQPHGEVLAGVDGSAAWAKASPGSGEFSYAAEVAAVLKEWMPRAQRESGHKVKVIRTDNGGEFIGADFEAVLKKGIQHQLTVPYNPQQNGVALVKNRVLATVGDKQWVPYTKWYGSAPAVNMLRAFSCMVVFQVPKEKREKLEASGRWVHVTVSEEEISGVTEDEGEPEVEEQQQQQPQQHQQQQDASSRAQRPTDRPRRDVRPPNRLTYPSFGKPKVVRAGSVAEQCDEEEIAHCYWAAVPGPKTLAEALSGPDAEKWKKSVKEEYDSLLENETWELCELPPGKKAISSKLIFMHKYGPDGALTRYKSRLVAKGFQQTKGKDLMRFFLLWGKAQHCGAVRQRLQRGAADFSKGDMLLTCYTDASFNSVKADGTSIGGYVCLFGGGAVSWRSKKQNEVGQSSCETEYMALHHGANEVVWLRRLLEEIGVCQKEPTVMFCNNESAVKLAKNACLHGLTKHIRPKWHWVRRLLDKEVRLEIVKTHQQAADILIKRLAESEHWKGMQLAGMNVH
ncbi:unnamed protein product [Closterium sp. NIES-54]